MTAMDHAAAHERIEDLLLEPTRLAALPRSTDPADAALREHVAGCPVCGADLEAWQLLQRRLAAALPTDPAAAAAAVEPIGLPPSLRAGVLGAVRAEAGSAEVPAGHGARVATSGTVPIAGARPRRRQLAGWLALAASIVLVVGIGAVTVDQVSQRTTAEAQARALSSAVAAVDRVLTAPDHRVVPLRDPAGAIAGSISWSGQDLVVLTTALPAPPAGQRYACWLLEGDSNASMIGTMYFAGRTAYWVGSLDEWATFRIGPNTRFAVTLQDPGVDRFSGSIVLSADLGT